MRDIANRGEDTSTIAWGYGLQAAPGALEGMVRHIRALHEQAVREHPMNSAIRERLEWALQELTRVQESSQGWFRLVRDYGGTQMDFDAYEFPRDGSVHTEARSSVGRAFDGH